MGLFGNKDKGIMGNDYDVDSQEIDRQLRRLSEQAQQSIYQNAANSLGTSTGLGIANGQLVNVGIGGAQGVFPAAIPAALKKETGALYWRGHNKLPEDWRGAEITSVARRYTPDTKCYELSFTSKWGQDVICLYLDAEKHSGVEADKIGETYVEALNQRRVG